MGVDCILKSLVKYILLLLMVLDNVAVSIGLTFTSTALWVWGFFSACGEESTDFDRHSAKAPQSKGRLVRAARGACLYQRVKMEAAAFGSRCFFFLACLLARVSYTHEFVPARSVHLNMGWKTQALLEREGACADTLLNEAQLYQMYFLGEQQHIFIKAAEDNSIGLWSVHYIGERHDERHH